MFERYSRSGVILMAAPLYAGPVAAGWSAAPVVSLGIFAAVFFLMQLHFGQAKVQDITAQVLALILLALAQIIIVALAYGLGKILALLTLPLPLPIWFPLALTGCSAGFSALRFRHSQDDAAMLDLIDRTLVTLETSAPFDADTPPPTNAAVATALTAAVATALTALRALPDTAKAGDIDLIVQPLEQQTGHDAYSGLLAAIDNTCRAVDFAMLRYLASPRVRGDLIRTTPLGLAFEQILNSNDPTILNEAATLIATLLQENATAHALPTSEHLRIKAKQCAALAPLIAQVQQAKQESHR